MDGGRGRHGRARDDARRWTVPKVCRHELPCALVLGYDKPWLLVAVVVLFTITRVVRWANRATARAQLRRMRSA